jgi:hypothetical protein
MLADRISDPRRPRFLAALLVAGLLSPLFALPAAAQPDVRDPRDFALTEEEGGGKDVVRAKDEDCSDDRARCLHIRWERDYETDAAVGPLITVNKVWVAKDVDTAKAIFRDEEKLQKTMPEGVEGADGPFTWEPPSVAPREPVADEWNGANACVKKNCYSQGRIDLHQRMIARTQNVVSTIYMFGRERTTTPDLLVYFTSRVMTRVNPPPAPSAAWFLPSTI